MQETIEIAPQPGKQTLFCESTADVVIYGGAAGAGKTFALTLQPLAHIENPDFGCMMFRRTSPEITNEGGMWDEAGKIYPLLQAEKQIGALKYKFPSGARISYRHIEYEKDLDKYQGSQITLICFDQLEHFTRKMFFYMLSRNRSTCGIKPYVRATCNPRPNWLADFLAWWIDQETGYPIQDRGGVIRYFIQVADTVRWADTKEELLEQFPHVESEDEIKSCTFIPATLTDNEILMTVDPGYKANLMAQSHVDRERLLHGNWLIHDSDGTEWPAEYFLDIWAEKWPAAFELSAIAVDPSKGKEKGDPSAIVFAGLSGGYLYVDADIETRPVEDIIADGVAMARQAWPDAFGLEINGFQELLEAPYNRLCQEQQIPPLPMHLINNQINKLIRIRRIGPYLKTGKIKVRKSPGGKILVRQLTGFPLPDMHDDGPDALEMAIRLLTKISQTSHTAETVIVA